MHQKPAPHRTRSIILLACVVGAIAIILIYIGWVIFQIVNQTHSVGQPIMVLRWVVFGLLFGVGAALLQVRWRRKR